MKTRFFSPRESPWLIEAAYLALPLAMQIRRVVSVDLPHEDWGRLECLRDTRLILSANHPTGTDPLIAMELARRLRQHFNYAAATENFERPTGWLIQRPWKASPGRWKAG